MTYENVELSGSLDISGSFQVPYGVSGSKPTSPSSGSLFFDTTDELLYVWEGEWQVVGAQVQPPAAADIEYLVVAGGGGGGGGGWGAGGGGAGGMLSSSLSSIESGSSITVTVGAGGTGRGGGNTFTAGGDGGISSIASSTGITFSTVTSTGGGGGGAESANSGLGRDGGSGGGSTTANASGGSGTTGQGNDGGAGLGATGPGYPGGGGGGKGSVGSAASGNNGGDGGTGQASSITGTSLSYAGGGGGGTRTSGAQGTGGSSVGGDGANASTAATSATANRGGGGGGAAGNSSADASNGGSGVVILAYPSSSVNAAGGITGDAGNGRKYHQFNESGTFKVGSTSDFQMVTDSLGLHIDSGDFASRGASTVTDLSGNGNNMSVTGASLGNDYFYSFSSTSTYLTCASNASIKSTTALTLEAWVRLTDLTNQWKPIFSKGSTDSTEEYILMIRPGNNVVYLDCGGGSLYAQPSFTWVSNTWYHIVATHSKPSGTSTMGVTINNSALSVTTNGATGAAGDNSDALYIGTARNNTIGGTGIEIAQARIYTKVLSTAEVLQNYNATKTNFI